MENWGLFGDWAEAVEDFDLWRHSNYVVLPFEGNWKQQPKWVRKNFHILLGVLAWHTNNAKKPDLGAGMPKGIAGAFGS